MGSRRELIIEAITNKQRLNKIARTTVRKACNFRRRAVWRYTKIEASKTEAGGSNKVKATSKPGLEIGLREEKTVRMIAMHEPAPANAASNAAINTSFRRMGSLPLFLVCLECPLANSARRAAKDTTGLTLQLGKRIDYPLGD